MNAIVQEEITGCAIASAAAIAGISYAECKNRANAIGIDSDDPALWSDTKYMRKLLGHLGFTVSDSEQRFKDWEHLPDCALLSVKWNVVAGVASWHWVVFVRENCQELVLDSKKGLRTNSRTDFGRMKPKWFLEVTI